MLKVFIPCGHCKICKFAHKERRSFKTSDGKKGFDIRSHLVVYMLECGCGLCYIGKTKRMFKLRALEHMRNILKGLSNRNVSRHFL